MDVISTGALPVASLVWQPRPGAWVLTVVCKMTYVLRPGECPLATAQEPVLDEDSHWSDDPGRSLRAPRDLVPVKPGADVILVGSVFAPASRPARAVDARLSVGEIDKTIEAVLDRTARQDGSVREGAPFTRMPLAYERAAGGPGTWNPVGMRRDARDAEGSVALPNLQRPGASLANVFEPVGFGPIAPSWPGRREKLGATGAAFSFRDLGQRPLPEGMDLAFFNAAPRDQQPRVLDERLRLALDNLHPDHPQLVTTVPASPPRAVLEGRRDGALAVTLRADTLWIDTDRGIATVTFRGMVPLQSADEPGRVVLSTGPERPPVDVAVGQEEAPGLARPRPKFDMTADLPLEVRIAAGAVLPFMQSSPAPAVPPAPVVARAPEPSISAPPTASPWTGGSATEALPTASPWTGGSAAEARAPAAPPAISRGVAPAPSVFEASTAAAGIAGAVAKAEAGPAPARSGVEADAAPSLRVEPQEAVALVWYDPEAVPRIRRKADWRPLLDALEQAPRDPETDDPAFYRDPMQIEDRREVFEVLARAAPTPADDVDAVLSRCLRADGKFVSALALFTGELELPFDELAALRATLTTASPFAAGDEALKSALQAARDFLATPGLLSAPAVAEALTRRIEDAFAGGKRAVAPGYLEAQRERALLGQRQYQRRAVLGGKHLRGLLRLGGSEAAPSMRLGAGGKAGGGAPAIPVYLPDAVAELLPMYPRFRARVVAEVGLSEDRYETHAAALRVLALARVTAPPRG